MNLKKEMKKEMKRLREKARYTNSQGLYYYYMEGFLKAKESLRNPTNKILSEVKSYR